MEKGCTKGLCWPIGLLTTGYFKDCGDQGYCSVAWNGEKLYFANTWNSLMKVIFLCYCTRNLYMVLSRFFFSQISVFFSFYNLRIVTSSKVGLPRYTCIILISSVWYTWIHWYIYMQSFHYVLVCILPPPPKSQISSSRPVPTIKALRHFLQYYQITAVEHNIQKILVLRCIW